ncbi:MAG: MFS transporter, partial [Sneathiella sp.]|nr:MFS transporter [Sneathiella sp.]
MDANRTARLKEKYGNAYKWLAGASVILGLLTTIFSSTMVNVALTDIMATFDITQASAQWMSTAFLSASSVAMLSTAWLMRAIGPRLSFLLAVTSFIIGSLLGWIAPSFEILIFARFLQGAGAGILQPLSMALVFLLFPSEIRGRAMGMFGMGVVLGPALGPIIGGVITDSSNWQTTFAIVLPLAAISALLGWIFLPDKKENDRPGQFNITSFALIAAAVGSLLIGLSNSQFTSFSDLTVYPYLLIAAVTFILFIRRELKSAAPLVQLEMFRNPRVTSSALIGALTSAGLFSSFYAIPLFVRTVQMSDATTAGMTLLPAGIIL